MELYILSSPSKPSSVLRGVVDSYSIVGHVGGGNRFGGLLRHTLNIVAMVYPSQGGRYHAEGCMALG